MSGGVATLASALVLAFICLLLAACRPSRAESNLIPRNASTALKGAAAIAIALAHIGATLTPEMVAAYGVIGKIAARLVVSWGSLGVAVFLFLSGFGNWGSVNRVEAIPAPVARWLANRVLRLLAGFLACFAVDAVMLAALGYGGIAESLRRLEMPGTTTWYVKCQIAMYIFIALARLVPRGRLAVLCLLSFCWAAAMIIGGFADFWWATSLCFAAGAAAARWEGPLAARVARSGLSGVAPLALFLVMRAVALFSPAPMLYVVYPILAFALCTAAGRLGFASKPLALVGGASYEVYLVHISFSAAVLRADPGSAVALLLFCGLSIVAAVIARFVTRRTDTLIKKATAKPRAA